MLKVWNLDTLCLQSKEKDLVDELDKKLDIEPCYKIHFSAVKDYRHFQNYFLHILKPKNMMVRMKVIDLNSN